MSDFDQYLRESAKSLEAFVVLSAEVKRLESVVERLRKDTVEYAWIHKRAELEARVHELEAKLASVEVLADAAADAHIQAASDQHAHAEAMQEGYLRRLGDQSDRIAELERELEVTRLRARSAEKLAGLNGE